MSQPHRYFPMPPADGQIDRSIEDLSYDWHIYLLSIEPTGALSDWEPYVGPYAGTSYLPQIRVGREDNGYSIAVTPPPSVPTYYHTAIALPVPQQQPQVVESQFVDPHVLHAWGHQQYGTVDGLTFPESINTWNITGHGASSALNGNADERPMSLHQDGLMETTESPHPIHTYHNASPGHLSPHLRHLTPHETAPAHPLSSSHTLPLAGPSTDPTFAPNYQGTSGSATQGSSVSSAPQPYSPHIPGPTRTRQTGTSSSRTTVVGAASQGSSSGGSKKPKARNYKSWGRGYGMRVPPEQGPRGRREVGAAWVLKEYLAITADLKEESRIQVGEVKNYYITTWTMYDNMTDNFMACDVEGCPSKQKGWFFRTWQQFQVHLKTHAEVKVTRHGGDEIYPDKYVQMMKRFRSLDTLVEDTLRRLANTNTTM